jgi:DNA helicase INO80
MTGAPPYNAQSPTQQHRYAAYSSPNKNHPYYPNNEQPPQQYHQHPPQTPPAFGPSSVARSPHFSHASSPMPSALPPPLNGTAPPHPPHPESSSQYQGHPAGGQLPPPRPYGASVLPGNGISSYGTSHGHPSSRPEGHSQSPTRESESPYRVRGNGVSYGHSMMREPRPVSPPQETVRIVPVTPLACDLLNFSPLRNLLELPTRCLSPASCPDRQTSSLRESRPLRLPPCPSPRLTLPPFMSTDTWTTSMRQETCTLDLKKGSWNPTWMAPEDHTPLTGSPNPNRNCLVWSLVHHLGSHSRLAWTWSK